MADSETSSHALIVSGGIVHDFDASSAELARILAECGYRTQIREDVDEVFTELGAVPDAASGPLLVMNMLRFTMELDRYAHLREEWAISLSPEARAGLRRFIESGGRMLAMHGASICFDDWPEWGELLGGRWVWGESGHPPLSPIDVQVRTDAHPIVAGVPDFHTEDEVYGFLELQSDIDGLAYSAHGGVDHPLLWARRVGDGSVVYDALGHDLRSLGHPAHRQIIGNAVRWLAGA